MASSPEPLDHEPVVGHTPILAATYPAVPGSVAPARAGAVRALRSLGGVDELVVEHVALAVSEACTNVVLHAYREGQAGELELRAWVDGDALRVCVTDRGVGLRPRLDSPGMGVGLQVISSVARQVVIAPNGPGTTLTMTFALGRRPI